MTDKTDGFDRLAWARGAPSGTDVSPRRSMVEAARAAGVGPGASRASVRDLLGEPDASSDTADRWLLGRAELAPDFQQFVVEYDGGGKVARATIRKL